VEKTTHHLFFVGAPQKKRWMVLGQQNHCKKRDKIIWLAARPDLLKVFKKIVQVTNSVENLPLKDTVLRPTRSIYGLVWSTTKNSR